MRSHFPAHTAGFCERTTATCHGFVPAAGALVYTASSMVKPRVDKLLDHSDSNYAAVVVAAKRARQINSYFHNLGEGGFGEYPPPMVETNAEGNYLTMALEELAEGKLKYEYRS